MNIEDDLDNKQDHAVSFQNCEDLFNQLPDEQESDEDDTNQNMNLIDNPSDFNCDQLLGIQDLNSNTMNDQFKS